MGGAAGMGAGGGLLGEAIAGLSGAEAAFSREERGRGGPMVPKRMAASCLAPPPVRSSSSSSDSSVDSMADHSSSSGRARVRGALVALATFSCVRRWKGFVDTAGSAGGVGTAGAEAVPLACGRFMRKGFLVSCSGTGVLATGGDLIAGGLLSASAGGIVVGTGGGLGVASRVNSWLAAGVDSRGVICCGSSSSDDSSPSCSSCICNCRSRSLAASISAR